MATVIHNHSNSSYSHILKFDHRDVTPLSTTDGESGSFEVDGILPQLWVLREIGLYVTEVFEQPSGEGSLLLFVDTVGGNTVEDEGCWLPSRPLHQFDGISMAYPDGGPERLGCSSGSQHGRVRVVLKPDTASACSDWTKGEAAILLNIANVEDTMRGIT